MSWDADLISDGVTAELGSWNYTHNTNRMIHAALELVEGTTRGRGLSWWKRLDNMTGAEGKTFLKKIIDELSAAPTHYRRMNPENGWGCYDTLLDVLIEMCNRVPDRPCTWIVSG